MALNRIIPLVEGKGYRAVRTLKKFTAVPADQEAREAPSVNEENRLFPPAEVLHQGVPQARGENGFIHVFHIHEFDIGKPARPHSCGKRKIFVLAPDRVCVGFEGRSRGTQQHRTAVYVSKHDRGVAGVITWRLVLLVGRLVLLVNHHKAEILKRSENRGTGTYHHAQISATCFSPDIKPLTLAKSAVNHRDRVGET